MINRMTMAIGIATLAAGVLAAGSAPAAATTPPVCAAAEAMVDRLAVRYAEAITARGVDDAGNLIVVMSNTATGTWTVLVIPPNNVACVVGSGEGWKQFEYRAPGQRG